MKNNTKQRYEACKSLLTDIGIDNESLETIFKLYELIPSKIHSIKVKIPDLAQLQIYAYFHNHYFKTTKDITDFMQNRDIMVDALRETGTHTCDFLPNDYQPAGTAYSGSIRQCADIKIFQEKRV